MRKILLSLAPVSAIPHKIDREKLVDDILESAEFGASMVHLHVRNENAKLTENIEFTAQIIEQVQKYSDIIIQVSTGGISDLTIQQRCVPVSMDCVESNSLNVGSVNLGEQVYINRPQDIRYCVEEILKYERKPEIEVFELGMLDIARRLFEQYHIPKPVLFSIVLGHIGAMPATVQALKYMTQSVSDYFSTEEAIWGITHAGRREFSLIESAIELGAQTVRLGFEDSDFISNGRRATKNSEIVKEFIESMKRRGEECFSPEEARSLLKIKKK